MSACQKSSQGDQDCQEQNQALSPVVYGVYPNPLRYSKSDLPKTWQDRRKSERGGGGRQFSAPKIHCGLIFVWSVTIFRKTVPSLLFMVYSKTLENYKNNCLIATHCEISARSCNTTVPLNFCLLWHKPQLAFLAVRNSGMHQALFDRCLPLSGSAAVLLSAAPESRWCMGTSPYLPHPSLPLAPVSYLWNLAEALS